MSDRYISDRFLPDKAIDLVDEAGAKLKMEITSKPQALDELDRKIVQLEMEKLSLTRGGAPADRTSRYRLETLEKDLGALEERQTALNAQWMAEKENMDLIQKVKEEKVDEAPAEIGSRERHALICRFCQARGWSDEPCLLYTSDAADE